MTNLYWEQFFSADVMKFRGSQVWRQLIVSNISLGTHTLPPAHNMIRSSA
jgi:hypothetical protein